MRTQKVIKIFKSLFAQIQYYAAEMAWNLFNAVPSHFIFVSCGGAVPALSIRGAVPALSIRGAVPALSIRGAVPAPSIRGAVPAPSIRVVAHSVRSYCKQ